jgi:cellulose biosynthesis protein BcsQ
MKVVATYSIKGGVGKTSAAVNLAALAARDGLRTMLWDLDPQAAASYLFRVKPKVKGGGQRLLGGRSDATRVMKGTDVEGVDLLPADFSYRKLDLVLDRAKRPTRRLRRVLRDVSNRYDLAILDCAPSISLVSESVFDAADALLVPLIPSTLSVRALEQLQRFLDGEVRRPPAVLAYFSMVDRRKRLHRELVNTMPGVAATTIPYASAVELMGLTRAPLTITSPRSPAALAYDALWTEARTVMGLGSSTAPGPAALTPAAASVPA